MDFMPNFSRYTDRARKVLSLAEIATNKTGYEEIQPFHVLMGFLRENSGVGADVLQRLGVNPHFVGNKILRVIESKPEKMTMQRPGFSDDTQRLFDYAQEFAEGLGHHYIGTEHLLGGLLHPSWAGGEGKPPAPHYEALTWAKVELERVSEGIVALLGVNPI